jgi:hypothetical protein
VSEKDQPDFAPFSDVFCTVNVNRADSPTNGVVPSNAFARRGVASYIVTPSIAPSFPEKFPCRFRIVQPTASFETSNAASATKCPPRTWCPPTEYALVPAVVHGSIAESVTGRSRPPSTRENTSDGWAKPLHADAAASTPKEMNRSVPPIGTSRTDPTCTLPGVVDRSQVQALTAWFVRGSPPLIWPST